MTDKKAAIILLPPWAILSAPLGISTIGQIFRKNQFACHIFDWNIEFYHKFKNDPEITFNKENPVYWDDVFCSPEWNKPDFFETTPGNVVKSMIENRLAGLINEGYKIFGFSVFVTNIPVVAWAIHFLRASLPEAFILTGGPGTYDAIEYGNNLKLLTEADYIFYTEAEESLDVLLNFAKNPKEKISIPGTAFFNNDKSLVFTPHNKRPDPALIPQANFDDLDLALYSGRGVPVEFSRGCIGKCHFCSETWRYKPYRPRPIENILNDFELMDNYNVDAISLICSTLNGDINHLSSFCGELIKNDNKIEWNSNAHMDKTLDAKLLKRMYQAGCRQLIFGLESASDHVLKIMNKRSDKKTALQIIDICADIGISLVINLLIGFPGETEEDLNETEDFIRNYYKKITYFSINKCCADRHATLGRFPEHFGVMTDNGNIVAVDTEQPPETGPLAVNPTGKPWEDWCTVDYNNTPYVRNRRFHKIIDCLNSLNKPKRTPQSIEKSDNILKSTS